MSAVTGILAGVVTVAGAVALYRYAGKRVSALKDFLAQSGSDNSGQGPILDFERDPETGDYKPRNAK